MLSKFKKLYRTDNFSYFIRYFAVFTLIFSLMTLIILQLMRSTMYRSSDENFRRMAEHPTMMLNFAIAKGTLTNQNQPYILEEKDTELTIHKDLQLDTNYQIVLYGASGQALNQLDALSGLSNLELHPQSLNTIQEISVESLFGVRESYRMMTVKLDTDELILPTQLEARYATILFNTTQIDAAIKAYEKTILAVMVSFWLISIFASIYLARLSLQPLLVSFQKQKEFVENASHELRTPLAVLQNHLEQLFRKPNATILESSESIAASLEEVRNMRRLTGNLLELARRDDGIRVETTLISPTFFDELFENYRLIADEMGKETTLTNQIHRAFHSDALLLKQLLTILFDNAVKYTGEDGHIFVDIFSKDNNLIMRVADNGVGISEDKKERIFERFYRVDKARTRQSGGFGLGLSLAKQIVDTLKGTITVKNHAPKGTIFEVKIPK